MRSVFLIFINIVLLCSMCVDSTVIYAQPDNEWKSCALSKEERVDEIILNVMGECTDDCNVTRNEALICIDQVAGLSDNTVLDTYVIVEYSDLYLYKDRLDRLCLLSQYNFYTYEKTLFLEETTNGFWGNHGYCFYPTNNCTIGYAIDLVANCIDKGHNNSVDLARNFKLCGEDMLERTDEDISIYELKILMCNMFDIAGEIYYCSDAYGVTDNEFITNNNISYYERYCNRKTYTPTATTIGNKEHIEAMENRNGVHLIQLRDFLYKYNKSIEWENGSIIVKDEKSSVKLCLDNFPAKTRMFTSPAIYAEHLVWENEWIVKDKSYTYLGEYEMINEHVYLYPYTLLKIIDYFQLV